MKTAVEWYSDKLLEILGDKVNEFTQEQTLANHYALKQAKLIELEQRKTDYRAGWNDNRSKDLNCEFYVEKHISNDFKTV